MQRLVDRMGISRQSLYDTYGNKRELFHAALMRYRRERIAPVIAEILRPETAPIDALRGFLLAASEGGADSPAGCLMVRTVAEIPLEDSRIADLVGATIGEIRDALRERIEQGLQSGDLASEREPEEIAGEVLALGIGLQIIYRLPNLGTTIRPSIESLLATLTPRNRSGVNP